MSTVVGRFLLACFLKELIAPRSFEQNILYPIDGYVVKKLSHFGNDIIAWKPPPTSSRASLQRKNLPPGRSDKIQTEIS